MSYTRVSRVKPTNTNPRRGRGQTQGYQKYHHNTSTSNHDFNSQPPNSFGEVNRFESACDPNENFEYSNRSNYRGNRQRIRGYGNHYPNNDNNSSKQSNHFQEEYHVESVRSTNTKYYGEMKPSNFRGNRKNNRGQGNFKTNYSEREIPKRSHSSSSNRSSRNDQINSEEYVTLEEKKMLGTDSTRLPRHAQHPIFVGELMPRFNNLLPSSEFLESEVHKSEQQIMSNQYNNDNQIHTFASISNNIDHGFRNSSNKGQNPINVTNRYTDSNNGFKKTAPKTSFGCGEPKSKFVIDNDSISPTTLPVDMISESNRVFAEDDKTQQFRSFKDKMNEKNPKHNKNLFADKITQFKSSTTDNNITHRNDFQKSGDMDSQFRYQLEPSSDFNRAKSMSLMDSNKKSKQGPSIIIGKQQLSHVNADKRNQILLDHGFKGMANTKSTLGCSKPNQNDTFKPQITSCTNISTLPSSSPSIVTSNLTSFELPRQINDYNSFLQSQKPSQHLINESKVISQEDPIDIEPGNINPSSFLNNSNGSIQNRLGLTNDTFPGGTRFNIQRTAVGQNQKVPTRLEAIQKKEDEYNISRLDYEEKRREKEAKKKEQYLAKYQHVDQGHRLDEGLLDEAAGYDPGFVESLEEVRQRQQQQLREDALFFQEQQREADEKRKKKAVDDTKAWLNKQKHVDAGYKLGGGRKNRGGSVRETRQQTGAALTKGCSAESNLVQQKTSSFQEGVHEQLREIGYSQQTQYPVAVVNPASIAVTVNSDVTNTTIAKEKNPTFSKTQIPEEGLKLLSPASFVINNKNSDPLLVLRATEETLNQTLTMRLKVQDDMDKHGHSPLYKPHCEKVQPNGVNTFENKSVMGPCKDIGAIPKQKPALPSPKPVAESSSPIINDNEQAEPVIDYQAEMRAARLRLQQQYEDALKKLQE